MLQIMDIGCLHHHMYIPKHSFRLFDKLVVLFVKQHLVYCMRAVFADQGLCEKIGHVDCPLIIADFLLL